MEVVSKFDFLLTNAEVIDIITENSKLPAGSAGGRCSEVLEMEGLVMNYLGSQNVDRDRTETLFRKLRAFGAAPGQMGLKSTELLNIANLRPASLVELYAIIDHAETRFGEERLESMLNLIAEELPETQ